MTETGATAIGERVLNLALAGAEKAFGPRLEAAYALGSLAHGGFSSLVSDVDLALILRDPLAEEDLAVVDELGSRVKESGVPLADRLSVFWGSRGSLAGREAMGRFPPLDRLDLLRHGRLLHGVDVRAGLPEPSHQDLVITAARFCLNLLARHDIQAYVRDPAGLLEKGARYYTKAVLFPVRFLYTARTGEIGRNHDAVEHLVTHHPGAAADLAGAALGWREVPASHHDARASALLREGLIPLYLSCLQTHGAFMRSWGEDRLAEDLLAAHTHLSAE